MELSKLYKMSREENTRRQSELAACILRMAETLYDDSRCYDESLKLQEIYRDGFKHEYSMFFPLLAQITDIDSEAKISQLSENMQKIKRFVDNTPSLSNIQEQVRKLADHINLEVSRLLYNAADRQRLSELDVKVEDVQTSLRRATRRLDKATKKASSMQTEIIAVLSIFSAIIIAFFGGLNFMTTAFSNLNTTRLDKLVLVIAIVGIVVFNTIFLLLYIVGKITDRNIYARCYSDDCTCGVGGRPKCTFINRIRKRLPYLFYFNLFMGVIVILSVIHCIFF